MQSLSKGLSRPGSSALPLRYHTATRYVNIVAHTGRVLRHDTHGLEDALEVFLRRELAQTSHVDFAVVRIAIRAFLLALRIGDVHREFEPAFYIDSVELECGLGG